MTDSASPKPFRPMFIAPLIGTSSCSGRGDRTPPAILCCPTDYPIGWFTSLPDRAHLRYRRQRGYRSQGWWVRLSPPGSSRSRWVRTARRVAGRLDLRNLGHEGVAGGGEVGGNG